MKKIYYTLTTVVCVFLIIISNRTQAQSTQPKLDQMELMKQFLGNWKGEIGKDTMMIFSFTSFGQAFEFNSTIFTKEKTLSSGKEIYGYNKKYDKIVIAAIGNTSPKINLYAGWFSSKDTGNLVGYQYISNPDESSYKVQWIFVPPDSAKRIVFRNNKAVSMSTYFREKNK